MAKITIKVAQSLEDDDSEIVEMPEQGQNQGQTQQTNNPHQMIDKEKVVEVLQSGQVSNLSIKEAPEKTIVTFEVLRPKILRPDFTPQSNNVVSPENGFTPPPTAAGLKTNKILKTASSNIKNLSKNYSKDLLSKLGL